MKGSDAIDRSAAFVQTTLDAVNEFERAFPGRLFTPDGHLVAKPRGSAVAVTGAFVVARGHDRNHRASIGKREDAHFAALQALFENDVNAAARQHLLLIPIREHGPRAYDIAGHDDAFAGRQTVGFHDGPAAPLFERALRLVEIVNDFETRGRNAVALHETLGEDFAGFEPAAVAIGAEDRNPGVSALVADAGGDRGLRPEHHQIDLRFASARDDRTHRDFGRGAHLG